VKRSRAVLITDAERSQQDQLRSRQIRYASMMGLRAVCLVVGSILVAVEAPLLWLWLPLCVAGMVLLPWLAVLIANDRPAREEKKLLSRLRRRTGPEPAQNALQSRPAARVIDADEP